MPSTIERLGQRRPHPVDEGGGVDAGPCPAPFREQGQELVATEPGDSSASPATFRSRRGHRGQHQVADVVAHGVVDGLEPVEVEEHHGHRARARPATPLSGAGQPLDRSATRSGSPVTGPSATGPVPPRLGPGRARLVRRHGRAGRKPPTRRAATLADHEQAAPRPRPGGRPGGPARSQVEARRPIPSRRRAAEPGGSAAASEGRLREIGRQQGVGHRPADHLVRVASRRPPRPAGSTR